MYRFKLIELKKNLFYINIAILMFVAGTIYFAFFGSSTKQGQVIYYSNKCLSELPKPRGHINDFVSLFLPHQINILDSIISNHEKQTGNQVAIITIDSLMLGKCSVDEYTMEIGNHWGVGHKGKNNGIVIGIGPRLRKISIKNGYGIQKILSNEETKQIIDSVIIPEFRKADYFEGTRKGLLAIFQQISN